MYAHLATRWTQFITPFGGIIALACFFSPWIGGGIWTNWHFSGFAWIKYRPLIGIALIASLVIIGLSFYMIIRRTPWRAMVPVFISVGIGIPILLQEYLRFLKLREYLEFTGEFGFWGTVVGFAVASVGVLLIKRKEVKQHSEMFADEKYARSIVHAAGIGALACFFMPWSGIGGVSTQSGFSLAKSSPFIGIALVASVAIVGVNFYMQSRGTLWKSKKPIFVSSGIGLGAIFCYYIDYFHMLNGAKELGVDMGAHTLQFGVWGTVLGFVAAVGMFLIRRKNEHKQMEGTAA